MPPHLLSAPLHSRPLLSSRQPSKIRELPFQRFKNSIKGKLLKCCFYHVEENLTGGFSGDEDKPTCMEPRMAYAIPPDSGMDLPVLNHTYFPLFRCCSILSVICVNKFSGNKVLKFSTSHKFSTINKKNYPNALLSSCLLSSSLIRKKMIGRRPNAKKLVTTYAAVLISTVTLPPPPPVPSFPLAAQEDLVDLFILFRNLLSAYRLFYG